MKKYCVYFILLFSSQGFSQQKTATQQAAINLFTQNKDVEAIAMFQKALQENPKDIFSLNALGVIYKRNNNFKEEYESSGKAMSITENKEPPFIIQHIEAGIELGKAVESLKLLDGLLMQDETLPFIPTSYLLRGQALDKLGRIQEAIGAYSKCIRIKSDWESTYYYRGKDFNGINRYSEALKDFDTYLEYDADAPSYVFSERGVALYGLNRFDEALKDFTKSIAKNPSDYMTYYNRGNTYRELGNYALAKADYQLVLNKTNQFAAAYDAMGQALYKEKAYKEALPMAEKAITMQPLNQYYLGSYGFILIGLDRERDAIAIADRILAIDDRNSDGWIIKGTCYLNLNDFNTGISTLTSGIEKLPNNYLLYMLRASIYRFAHNEAAAAADDAKAKELSIK